jgi:hypothetical protein
MSIGKSKYIKHPLVYRHEVEVFHKSRGLWTSDRWLVSGKEDDRLKASSLVEMRKVIESDFLEWKNIGTAAYALKYYGMKVLESPIND